MRGDAAARSVIGSSVRPSLCVCARSCDRMSDQSVNEETRA